MRYKAIITQFDLVIVLLLSSIFILIILFFNYDFLRIPLSIPFIIFFPGYSFISALFPRSNIKSWNVKSYKNNPKSGKEQTSSISLFQRFVFSIGFSVILIPLIGLFLHFTYELGEWWGIKEKPYIFSIYILIIVFSSISLYRRHKLPNDERFILKLDFNFLRGLLLLDKLIIIGATMMILSFLVLLTYIQIFPLSGETYTEFYILNSERKAGDYPYIINLNETNEIIIGVINHENKDLDYIVVIRLIPENDNNLNSFVVDEEYNYTLFFLSNSNSLVINPYSIYTMNLSIEENEKYEINMTFEIKQVGYYKLEFLLYIENRDLMTENSVINFEDAYRDLYIWVDVIDAKK